MAIQAFVIRCVCLATGQLTIYDGQYLRAYDPDGCEGAGKMHWTSDIEEAKKFQTASEAISLYSQVSTVRPKRADGMPNRPLTAYHLMLDAIEVPDDYQF